MALVKLQPSSGAVNNQTTLPEVLGKDNESTFTSLYPESKVGSLLKYVEGYPWTVRYYGQIVNTVNTLEHLDPSTPALNQPYYEIVGAIIQVSSPLTNAYDEASAITSINGSALVPFKLTPNVGDLFVAQVDTGEDAIFIVNSVYRKTHRKDTLYEINYALYQYTSSNPGLLLQLQARVQETYHFNKDSQFYNRDALITPLEHQNTLDLKELVQQSQAYYFSRFLKKEVGSILLPGVDERIYDPYLLMFIMKTVSHDAMSADGVSQYTLFERYTKQPVFWELLLTRNMSRAYSLNKHVGFARTGQIRNRSRFGTIYHAGVDFVGLPLTPNTDDDITFFDLSHPNLWRSPVINVDNGFVHPALVKTANNGNTADKALLHPLFVDDSYVVSQNFYNYVDNNQTFAQISYIEWLLFRFIRRDAISKKDVVSALQSYGQWSVMHQLYLLPALWLLAKN